MERGGAQEGKRRLRTNQFNDTSSGIAASRRYLPPFWRRIVGQSFAASVLKTSSSEAGWVSQALRFISSSSWPGLQPAYPAKVLIFLVAEKESPSSTSESRE